MECQLKLSRAQHELVWRRKTSIQNRFKVQIDSPCSYGDAPYEWMYKGFGGNEILIISAKGKVADVEALEKYLNEAFVNPEIIEFFSYSQDLKPIFENPTWVEIFEEIYSVYISTKPECELNISGAESSVSAAASAMEELKVKYDECKDTLSTNNGRPLVHHLVQALQVCRDVNISLNTFNRIPDEVITLLLSLLKKIYKENFPEYDESASLEDSVLILDPPDEKVDVSVIVLDSDTDDSSGSLKRGSGNGSEGSSRRKKQKKSHRMENRLKKFRNRKNGNTKGGCNSQNQNLKVESSMERERQPILDNALFVPLTLGTNNDSVTKVPANQVDNHPGEAQAQPTDVQPEPAEAVPKRLRPIVIDGCNVAFYSSHNGRREDFSWKRIATSIDYFQKRGHTDVKAFIPQYRRALCYEKAGNQELVETLESQQVIIFTPSRRVDGKIISCYDDRFIVDLAFRKGGVILSNDNYRDLMLENKDWEKTIKERLLMYLFAGDDLMIPEDPLGAKGPRLNDFLAFPDGE